MSPIAHYLIIISCIALGYDVTSGDVKVQKVVKLQWSGGGRWFFDDSICDVLYVKDQGDTSHKRVETAQALFPSRNTSRNTRASGLQVLH